MFVHFLIKNITNEVESWLSCFESYAEKLLFLSVLCAYGALLPKCNSRQFYNSYILYCKQFMLNDWVLPFLISPWWALISKVILSNMDFLNLHCYAGHVYLRVRHGGTGILCFKYIACSRICLFLLLRLFSKSLQLATWPYYTNNQSRWQITLPPLKGRLYTAEIKACYECNASYWNKIFQKTISLLCCKT